MNVSYTSQVTGESSGNTIRGEGDIDDGLHGPGWTITYTVTADIVRGRWAHCQHGGGAHSSRASRTRIRRTTEPRTTTGADAASGLGITKTDGMSRRCRGDAVDVHDRGDQRRAERGAGALITDELPEG